MFSESCPVVNSVPISNESGEFLLLVSTLAHIHFPLHFCPECWFAQQKSNLLNIENPSFYHFEIMA